MVYICSIKGVKSSVTADLPCAGGRASVGHLVHASCASRVAGVSLERHKHAERKAIRNNNTVPVSFLRHYPGSSVFLSQLLKSGLQHW